MKKWYNTSEYKEEIFDRVGLNDLAVELNSRFIADVYAECEKEYAKTQDVQAYKPTEQLHLHFIDMISKSFQAFQLSKLINS